MALRPPEPGLGWSVPAADDADEMNGLPPWKLAEREAWAEAHLWLAGFYFGLLMTLAFAGILILAGSPDRLYFAAFGGLVSWPLFVVGVKRRWGQRPDAKEHPPPTYWRRWSRASDTWLSWFMWLSITGVVVIGLSLLTRTVRAVFGVVGLVAALDLALTTWMERRRRRRPG